MISFSATISACARGGQYEHALQLLDSMRKLGVSPDVTCYNAVINCCEVSLLDFNFHATTFLISFLYDLISSQKGDQSEKAINLLSEMKQNGLRPDM